ncbi:MAG TPA: NADH-quinone oxidoreductase subunit NuoG [Hanamia sp.]|nr:NADH-quinone oxidoreductase subunit NuoG [Hanamia sp.]
MMVNLYIDDVKYQVDSSKNLLENCLALGLNLPYFCWHPALHSVGACRQCAILKYKDENDKRGRLAVACLEPTSDNLRISMNVPKAHDFRAGIIESLMLNHPHDCPVCDEGGECHLQDMTVMTGHNYRRATLSTFKKQTFNNQFLGPFINHEMNRCIECYRCTRFYNDYAGGKDFNVFASADKVFFGRAEDGVLENEFSGNLVEVCPTGVFTDKTLKKHYTRKWDLTSAASICHGCSIGCNILAGERYGSIRRVLNRYNGEVNGYFICDRGRFGYEYINSEKRIISPQKNQNGTGISITKADAIQEISQLVSPGKKIVGIGSPKASMESNYTLMKLVGKENFYSGVSKSEGELIRNVVKILKDGKVRTPSLRETEQYDSVFILGEDVTNTAPMLALSLRQASRRMGINKVTQSSTIPIWNDAAIRLMSQEEKGPFYIASTANTRLDDIATKTYKAYSDNIARLGFAVAHIINSQLPEIKLDENTQSLAKSIAEDLLASPKPLVVAGTGLYNASVIEAAANVANALKDKGKDIGLVFVVPEANSMGLEMLTERYLEDALLKIEQGDTDTTIILENDLYHRLDKNAIDNLFKKSKNTIALNYLENETTKNCDYVIPAGTFAEADGTIISNEGRVQRFFASYAPRNEVMSSWKWLNEIKNNSTESINNLDDVINDLVNDFPGLKAIKPAAPDANFREGTEKIPREPHRYTGRTAMHANENVSEEESPKDPDSPLSFTMEGYPGKPQPAVIPFIWSPGWNSAQAINKYQVEMAGPLKGGDPGIRLFELSENNGSTYFENIPNVFSAKEGEWTVLPLYHIFGSEELSAQSPAVKTRVPAPYVALNINDAAKAGINDGEPVAILFNDQQLQFPVNLKTGIAEGIIGLPKGLDATKGIQFPFLTKIKIEKR